MKACQYHEYCSVDVMKLATDVAIPEINEDEVMVEVVAAALNPVDHRRTLGQIKAADRSTSSGNFPVIPGLDVAEVVVKVGSEVKGLKEGDEVYGDVNKKALIKPTKFGTLAEYVVVDEKLQALKPKNMYFVQASALLLATETAYEGLEKAIVLSSKLYMFLLYLVHMMAIFFLTACKTSVGFVIL